MVLPKVVEVLMFEDNPEDRTSVIRRLRGVGSSQAESRYRYNITAVESLRKGVEISDGKRFDVILLDLSLPDAEGLEAVAEIRRSLKAIPLIVLTGRDDEELAGKALHAGAQDYLVKGLHDEIIGRTILRSIERHEMILQLEEARAAALAASEMKSRFLANMSHEIRTPLTSVIGFTESVLTKNLSEQESRMALTRALSNGRHLLRLLDDVLSFSKIEAGKLSLESLRCSPLHLCREVVGDLKMQAVEKGLALRFDPQFPLPATMLIDPTRFKQVLYNLLGNALKFTIVGGVKVTLSCDVSEQMLVVAVRDTGIGMSEETRDGVFQSFTQAEMSTSRRFGGTGLGLSISKQLVEMFHGQISVESKPSEGSTFTFRIPSGDLGGGNLVYEVTESIPETVVVSEEPTNYMCGRVLVVDDMPDNRQLIDLLLSKCGLEVSCADSGVAALNMALNEEFDLVLMDMHMPNQDGYETAAAFREKGITAPIVAVTASAVDTAFERCINVGCNDFLRKPFEVEKLYKVVQKQLQGVLSSASQGSIPGRAVITSEDLRSVQQIFLSKLPARLAELDSAIQARDWKTIHAVSHGLCSAGQFGYKELTRAARAMERQAIARSELFVDRTWSLLREAASKVDGFAGFDHNDSSREGTVF